MPTDADVVLSRVGGGAAVYARRLAGVCVGIGVLDEAWPARPLMSAMRFCAFALIIGGVLAMNWHKLRKLTLGKSKSRATMDDMESPFVGSPNLVASPGGELPSRCHSPTAHPATRRV